MRILGVLFFTSSLAWATSSDATSYTIKPDGSGDFPTIQAAITAVGNGDVIELSDGTFTGDGNRDLDFLGKAITVRSQSGNPDACVIECGGVLDNPHRGFYFHSGETAASLLEGVTIRGGFGQPDAGLPDCCGAGILCTDGSSPTISNCVLTANEAGGTGGGMFCNQSSPTVNGSTFSDNKAQTGAGLLCANDSNPALTTCTFSGNAAGGSGGGLTCALFSSPTLTACVFSANSSEKSGGAIWCTQSASPILSACVLSGNIAGDTWSGGAIHCEDSSSPTLDSCSVSDNSAGYGGGIGCAELSSPVVKNCTFSHNSAARYYGGGIFCFNSASPQVETCTFSANSAEAGGGMAALNTTSLFVSNCTFSGNTAIFGSGLMADETTTLTMTHTIVAHGIQGEGVACSGTNVSLSCCDLFGNAGGDWVGCIATQNGVDGNFSEDPLFCDRDNQNFDLHQNSPCAAAQNPACGLVGARVVSCGPTTARPTTWGRLKAGWW